MTLQVLKNPRSDVVFSMNYVEDLRSSFECNENGSGPSCFDSVCQKKRLRMRKHRNRKPHREQKKEKWEKKASDRMIPDVDNFDLFPQLSTCEKTTNPTLYTSRKYLNPLPIPRQIERLDIQIIKGEDGFSRIQPKIEYKPILRPNPNVVALPFSKPLNYLSALNKKSKYGSFKLLNNPVLSTNADIFTLQKEQLEDKIESSPLPKISMSKKSITQLKSIKMVRKLCFRSSNISSLNKQKTKKNIKPHQNRNLFKTSKLIPSKLKLYPIWHQSSNWNCQSSQEFNKKKILPLKQKWQKIVEN